MDTMTPARIDFRAMGTDCAISVWSSTHAEDLARLARTRVEILEECWSRFRATSELSLLNARAGQGPIEVSEDLHALVAAMTRAWEMTGGAFDPTVGTAMRAWGYDVTFADVITRNHDAAVALHPAPGMAGVAIDGCTVTLPSGVELDPGAIGKGLAADIIAREIHAAGATGVLVDLGGDIVVRGRPGADTWRIAVTDERSPELVIHTFEITDEHAGIATSSVLRRRWAGTRHHVIDPMTGAIADTSAVQVTVLAPSGADAEVIATAAILSRNPHSIFHQHGVTGIALGADSTAHTMENAHE
ncbi:MAG: FAD:protein FMN transferase [Actinomycetota bacterium]